MMAYRSGFLVAAAGLFFAVGGTVQGANVGYGVPVPEISRGQGDSCIRDTEFMRRNHMTMLLHQRNETVRKGIRGEPFSLKRCITCHAVKGADGLVVSIDSPRHFCRSCHDYAAVSIDCFQCHSSKPGQDTK